MQQWIELNPEPSGKSQPQKKSAILLRFVSKNGIDFNVISTGFSTVAKRTFGPKIAQNGDQISQEAQVRVSVRV
jgi:hypothetical protein